MGCGSSKDGTADSPKKAASTRKSNAKAEQVEVDVSNSNTNSPQRQRATPSPTNSSPRKSPHYDDSYAGTQSPHPESPKHEDVKGKGGKSKYEDKDEGSFQEANDKGYKRRVRERLKTSTGGSDMEDLEKMIALFERSRLEDCGDLTRAKERLRYLKLKRDLRDSMRRRHVGVLNRTIADVQASPYAYQLRNQLEKAEKLRDHLKELNTYNHDILQMEQTTISELRSYQRPPTCVHDVMAATYMLLGHNEDRLTEWADIQCQMGKLGRDGLVKQVETFDTNDVDDQTASRVQEILGYHDLDQVRAASNGAASFHVWSSQMVEKIDKDKQSEDDTRRQEEEKQSVASSKGRKKKG
ncbi:LOW QUALITY PROTEIN: uncharacterized protein LOC124254478 [Haliotis rubra]|uniref:LOW QUALITY PROTEIN: uncharacterized protein LOC124254478 n=1 Tax=Haliotis rubra TaxID=36100 RepID=UPI001EE56282|nr:LOW QUALITY PROTEIN: uncharacterized protein LOC124254478 [Haliotis rubra]